MPASSAIAVYNPLPQALAHYEAALRLAAGSWLGPAVAGGGVELGGGGALRKADVLRRHVRVLRSAEGPLIDLWPGLGHLESVVLSRRKSPSALVFHDPDPIRDARGYGALARHTAAATSSRVVVVAHSEAARARLLQIGYRHVVRLPHPTIGRQPGPRPEVPVVRVLGQYKASRDLPLLESIGGLLRGAGLRGEIVGRGWPAIPGWDQRQGFVAEDEFDALVSGSSAVLVPYTRFWQSGVALRSLEHGVPVVGVRGGFLTEVLGPDATGLVDVEDRDDPHAWLAAVMAAIETAPDEIGSVLRRYATEGHAAMTDLFERLAEER